MEDRSKHIDDLFREGLGDYRETPPADVWASLEKRLPEPEDGSSRKWIWLLLLLLIGTAGYVVYNSLSDTKHTAVSGQANKTNGNKAADDHGTPSVAAATSVVAVNDASASTNDVSDTAATVLQSGKTNSSRNDVAGMHNSGTANRVNRKTPGAQLSDGDAGGQPLNNGRRSNSSRNADGHISNKVTTIADAAPKENNGVPDPNTTAFGSERKGRPTSKTKNTDGSDVPDRSLVTANATDPGKIRSAAAESGNSKTGRSDNTDDKVNTSNKTKNATRQNNDKDDNSYLRQPVPEDDEENTNEGGQKTTASNKANSASSPEDETKKKLLYIPPDESLVPIAPSKTASGNKTSGDKATAKQEHQADVTSVSGETGKEPAKPALRVTGASDSKKPITVQPATFTDRKKQQAKAAKSSKGSGMNVRSDVPTDPDEHISFKPQEEQGSQAILAANGDKINLAATNNQALSGEETANPSSGGGGGGGGGATSPVKNGSKFRFDLGIKAGYERGFQSFTTNTFIIAPYLQWNISTGFAFVFQPGFRYNQLTSNGISGLTSSYHQVTSETVTPNHVVDSTQPGPPTIQRNYIYNSTYDSVVVGTRLKANSYWEIELPVLLRYKIASNLAVFGGLSLMFGNIINTEEVRTSYSGLSKTSTLSFPKDTLKQDPTIPPASGYFSYNTPDLSTAPPPAETQSSNSARLGLMLGFSYEFQNRVTIDLMYKQTVSDMRYIQNEQIRKVYTQPNIRIMVGFKLFGAEKKADDVKKPEGF